MLASSPTIDHLSLVESFELLGNPCHGEIYLFEEIAVLVICATTGAADAFVSIEKFGEACLW